MLVFAAREEGAGASLLSADDLGSLIYKVALVVLVGAGVLALFRDRFTQALEATLLWVVIGLLLALGYTYRFELRDVGERVLAEIMPGRAATRGRAVEIARSGSGEFQVSAQINGARLPMVLDTGASAVALTSQAAKAAGLPIELVKYTVSIDTANGQTHAAAVTLDRITVGGIVERSVPALIAQPGQLRKSLLGMSFLNRLQGWEVRGDKLLLRGYP
ncbi:MAG: TIGR02281 family clan AA aspartic protease [Proteobacteria bacterium]|nr:TIGR02281 family clan AA aspartic protease [Pseudomonadota bacterium]